MSYILDALTKAAQQRERQVPVVQRLLSRPATRSPGIRVPGGSGAALAVGAGLLVALGVWWLLPVSSVGRPDQSAVIPAAPPAPVPTPRSIAAEPPRPMARLEPTPDPQVATPPPRERPPLPEAPARTARPAPLPTPGSRSSTPLPPPAATAAQPPTARPPAAPPTTATRPASPAERSELKLEALIYSDLPTQRMVFINGRRYVEGDLVDGRLRIEEIQEEGVELSDQGRRFTLRATR
jgi:hypothetical protein